MTDHHHVNNSSSIIEELGAVVADQHQHQHPRPIERRHHHHHRRSNSTSNDGTIQSSNNIDSNNNNNKTIRFNHPLLRLSSSTVQKVSTISSTTNATTISSNGVTGGTSSSTTATSPLAIKNSVNDINQQQQQQTNLFQYPNHHHHHSTSPATDGGTTGGATHLNHNQNHNNAAINQYHLESHVLMGLTIAGVASTIIHTMMGLQTERHVLLNIATSAAADSSTGTNRHNDIIRNLDIANINDNNYNNVSSTIATAATTFIKTSVLPVSQIMIRTTMSPKLHYDLVIRLIGTAIIFYYSVHPLPFQQHNTASNNISGSSSKATIKIRTRLDMIGSMGLLFAFIFVIVQFNSTIKVIQPLYEWMRILLIVVIASPVINDLSMYDYKRIQFIMSGQVINFVTTIFVRYICEQKFGTQSPDSMSNPWNPTNIFFTILSCTLFVVAQNMINNQKSLLSPWYVISPFVPAIRKPRMTKVHTDMDLLHTSELQYQQHTATSHTTTSIPTTSAYTSLFSTEWYRIVRDMFYLHNVQRWIVMQLLLEIQMSVLYLLFLYNVLYEMDDIANSRVVWTLFRLRKIDTILVHVPMFLFGYTGVYHTLFATIFGLSLLAKFSTIESSDTIDTVHLLTIVFYISCMSVHSAGFNVAMADLTMSIRHHYYTKSDHHPYHHHRRSNDEPNLAGIVIAYNSFICKPITYFVSGIVANMLQHSRSNNTVPSTAFNILVYTSFVTSTIQLVVWRQYELIPQRTALMRDEIAQSIPK